MKIDELVQMTDEELQNAYEGAKEALFKLRMQQSTAQLDRPSRMGDLRRDVARCLTVMNNRQREGAQANG